MPRNRVSLAVVCASSVVLGISIALLYWDYLMFKQLEIGLSRAGTVQQIWRVWSRITVSVIWFAIPVYALLRKCCRFRVILWTCVTVLLASGPNLFVLSLLGCATNAILPSDICLFSWLCESSASALLPLFFWFFLFLTSAISSWVLLFLLNAPYLPSREDWDRSTTHSQADWTYIRTHSSSEVLLELNSEELCCICLGKYSAGESVQVLNGCGHKFHCECLEGWVGYGMNCPVCRREIE